MEHVVIHPDDWRHCLPIDKKGKRAMLRVVSVTWEDGLLKGEVEGCYTNEYFIEVHLYIYWCSLGLILCVSTSVDGIAIK